MEKKIFQRPQLVSDEFIEELIPHKVSSFMEDDSVEEEEVQDIEEDKDKVVDLVTEKLSELRKKVKGINSVLIEPNKKADEDLDLSDSKIFADLVKFIKVLKQNDIEMTINIKI